VTTGDARLALLAEQEEGRGAMLDVLAVDAFSGDAIPVHLLTREAFALYLSRLAPGGILAVHISNKSLDLAPVVGRLAQELGLAGTLVQSNGGAGGVWSSRWALLARQGSELEAAGFSPGDAPLPVDPGRCWTDQYSNILSVMR
jgi:hypothetical protein